MTCRPLTLAAVVALAAGCYLAPSSTASDDAPTDALVGSPDVAGSLDASGGADAGAAARHGFVALDQTTVFSAHPVLSAFFGEGSPAGLGYDGDFPCAVVEVAGPCQLLTCWPLLTSDLAGTVSATDASGSIASTSVPLGSTYYMTHGAGSTVAAGDAIVLGATGATVPPFEGSVTMPPTPPSSWGFAAAPVSHSGDYVFSWSAIAADQVWVGIGVSGRYPQPPVVQCSASSSVGTITIPASMTAHFAVDDEVELFLATANVQSVTVGDYRIQLTASQTADLLLGRVTP